MDKKPVIKKRELRGDDGYKLFSFESRKRPQKSLTPYRRKPTVHAMSLSTSCWIGR